MADEQAKQLLKVMLVDDEPSVLKGLEIMIDWEKYGFQITGTADSGRVALKRIKQEQPDLVITDIKMPGLSGLDLIREISAYPEIKVLFIVVSGYDQFDFAQKALKYGVKDYLLKPVDENDLIASLKKLYQAITANRGNVQDLNLLKGFIKGEQPAEEQVKFILNKQQLLANKYLIMLVDLKAKIRILEPQQLKQIINRVLPPGDSKGNLLVLDHNKHFIVLFSGPIVDKIQERQLSEHIHFELKKQVVSSLYFGNQVEHYTELPISYQNSIEAANFSFFKGEQVMIYYDEIKDSTVKKDYKKIIILTQLINDIENNNLAQIQKIIEQVFDDFVNNLIAPDVIELFVHGVGIELTKIISEMNGNIEDLLKSNQLFNTDLKAIGLGELKRRLIRFCLASAGYIKQIRMNRSKGIIYEIKAYIDQHFQENLKLQGVADKFFMNATYLGQLFKNYTGDYFNDYIHKLRIKKAKDLLLRRTDLRIYQIATEVGYSNSEYFSEKFKIYQGCTPTQYKKRKGL